MGYFARPNHTHLIGFQRLDGYRRPVESQKFNLESRAILMDMHNHPDIPRLKAVGADVFQ